VAHRGDRPWRRLSVNGNERGDRRDVRIASSGMRGPLLRLDVASSRTRSEPSFKSFPTPNSTHGVTRKPERTTIQVGLTSRTAPAIMRRHPHSIAASGRAAPAARMILGRVVEKSAASRIGAALYERKISVT
jgi:hypothetical protein